MHVAIREVILIPFCYVENEPQPEQVAQLAQEAYNNDLLQLVVQNIAKFEFEVRFEEMLDTNMAHLYLADSKRCSTNI